MVEDEFREQQLDQMGKIADAITRLEGQLKEINLYLQSVSASLSEIKEEYNKRK
jgi:hypothetical protein